MRILVMGLPGSGKTTFAAALGAELFFNKKFTWFNADAIRERYNDWDFSPEGRLRQAKRMRELADKEELEGRIVIADFVAPIKEMRDLYDADITVWMDTIAEGRFEDTNKLFDPPIYYDYRVTSWDDYWVKEIAERILSTSSFQQ